MTKEETLAYIKAYLDGDTAVGNIIPLRSVLESAIKYLSEPSLPSDLDEAAEKDTIERAINALVNLPSLVIPSNYIAYFRKKMMEDE